MTNLHIGRGDALLVVDVQNDFLPGGALGVRDGDAVIAPLNAYIERCRRLGVPGYATRVGRRPDQCAFEASGGPRPGHCVAGTRGAGVAPALEPPADVPVVSKATEAGRDGCSAFGGTDLDQLRRRDGVRRI